MTDDEVRDDGKERVIDDALVAEVLAMLGVDDPTTGLSQKVIDRILTAHAKGRWIDPDEYPYEQLTGVQWDALVAEFRAAPRP